MVWSSSPTPNTSERGPASRRSEQDVGRGEVLELVDQQHPADPAGGGPGCGVGAQHLDGTQDLLIEVDCAR